ncbi:MAG: DUF5667 domain-containing protein [Chloroflexota bacterium]|nr:DUF5667 domain-containing protein [Chloroflexota bacterium]
MTQKIADVLENCLERIFRGENIGDCLQDYPEQSTELEPLLKFSCSLIQKSSAIQPGVEFKDRVRSQLQRAVSAKSEPRRTKIPIWRRRWAVALTSILIIFVASMGAVTASQKALPNEPLYPMKLAAERVNLALTFSDLDKAELHIQFAQRRTAEMAEVARWGEADEAFLLSEKASAHLDQLDKILGVEKTWEAKSPKILPTPLPAPFISQGGEVDEAGNGEGLAAILDNERTRNLNKLQTALDKAPEELKPLLKQAIADMEMSYDKTIFIIQSRANS